MSYCGYVHINSLENSPIKWNDDKTTCPIKLPTSQDNKNLFQAILEHKKFTARNIIDIFDLLSFYGYKMQSIYQQSALDIFAFLNLWLKKIYFAEDAITVYKCMENVIPENKTHLQYCRDRIKSHILDLEFAEKKKISSQLYANKKTRNKIDKFLNQHQPDFFSRFFNYSAFEIHLLIKQDDPQAQKALENFKKDTLTLFKKCT